MNNQKARYTHHSTRERHPADEYPTPSGFTNTLLDFLQLPTAKTILEPCAGGGHTVKALRDRGYSQIEFHDLYYDGVDYLHGDARLGCVDWVSRGEGLFQEFPPSDIILCSRRMRLYDGTSSSFNHVWLVTMPEGRAEGVWLEEDGEDLI